MRRVEAGARDPFLAATRQPALSNGRAAGVKPQCVRRTPLSMDLRGIGAPCHAASRIAALPLPHCRRAKPLRRLRAAPAPTFRNAMDSCSQLKVVLADHVATVTLANPPVNALTRVLNDELIAALDRLSETDEVRVVVLTGEGRVFCAGADLKGRSEVIKGPGDLLAHSRRTRECFHAVRECAKPVIAAINGPALGAGLALVASADVLLASEKASLGLPEVDVGLLGGCRHAMRLFGHSRLRRMALTGDRMDGAELYRLGIVEACVAPEELMPQALALAARIAAKSPVSTRMGKHTMNVIEDMSLRDGYRYEQDMTAIIAKTDDAREAQAAFREKRSPVFTGR